MELVDRLIVFCKTIAECEELKINLNMPMIYHSQLSKGDKTQIANAWHTGTSGQGLIATGAFGKGIDYPHVRHVIHCSAPRSLYDGDQEANRAGRDGGTAFATIFYSSIPAVHDEREPDHLGVTPLHHLLMQPDQCQRFGRGLFWDREAHSCAALTGAQFCSTCESQAPSAECRRVLSSIHV
jgi:superfamily II DNA helicase RecQ